MVEKGKVEPAVADTRTTVERTSEREFVVARTFNAPARLVYQSWTTPDLFMRWWTPKSSGMTMISCQMDVRVGGGYRIEFGHSSSEHTMAFFGNYIDVTPNARLVWTNDESENGAVTTVTFEEKDGRTLLVLRDAYPSKEALDEAIASGSTSGACEQFEQLDELLASLPR